MRVRGSNPVIRGMYAWAKEKGYGNTIAQLENEPSPFGYNLSKVMVLKKIKE